MFTSHQRFTLDYPEIGRIAGIMTRLQHLRLWIPALVLACTGDDTVARNDETVVPHTSGEMSVDLWRDTLLVARLSDSVSVRIDSGVRRIEWSRTEGNERLALFRSGDLYAGTPQVQLIDANEDGVLDLFVQWWYEEQMSGVLLLGSPRPPATVAYSSPPGLCRPPLLSDVDGDGTLEIVERWPGAVSLDDCTIYGDFDGCVDSYNVDWQMPLYRDSRTSLYDADSLRAKPFFRERSRLYSETVDRLRTQQDANSGDSCGLLVSAVDSLRLAAQRLGESRPF